MGFEDKILIFLDINFLLLTLVAIGTGAFLVFGLLRGRLQGWIAVVFLRCALAGSVMGLFWPLPLSPIHRLAFLTVYVSGVAIIAWRRFHLAGLWQSVFAFAVTAVLGLNVLAASSQVWSFRPRFNGLATTTSAQPQTQLQLLVAALFVGLGIAAVFKFRLEPAGSSTTVSLTLGTAERALAELPTETLGGANR